MNFRKNDRLRYVIYTVVLRNKHSIEIQIFICNNSSPLQLAGIELKDHIHRSSCVRSSEHFGCLYSLAINEKRFCGLFVHQDASDLIGVITYVFIRSKSRIANSIYQNRVFRR